jgi:hypothetical protein
MAVMVARAAATACIGALLLAALAVAAPLEWQREFGSQRVGAFLEREAVRRLAGRAWTQRLGYVAVPALARAARLQLPIRQDLQPVPPAQRAMRERSERAVRVGA